MHQEAKILLCKCVNNAMKNYITTTLSMYLRSGLKREKKELMSVIIFLVFKTLNLLNKYHI